MKITDLSNKQESKIAQELENLSSSEASIIVGGVTLKAAVRTAVLNDRNPPSDGCGGVRHPPILNSIR